MSDHSKVALVGRKAWTFGERREYPSERVWVEIGLERGEPAKVLPDAPLLWVPAHLPLPWTGAFAPQAQAELCPHLLLQKLSSFPWSLIFCHSYGLLCPHLSTILQTHWPPYTSLFTLYILAKPCGLHFTLYILENHVDGKSKVEVGGRRWLPQFPQAEQAMQEQGTSKTQARHTQCTSRAQTM